MQALDIVKEEPKDSLEEFSRWMNRMTVDSRWLNPGRKIEVVEKYDCAQCGIETDYYKFGGICGRCEALSELGMS